MYSLWKRLLAQSKKVEDQPRDFFGLGLIPVTFHCDGAEFFNNTEFLCWSFGSVLAGGNDPCPGQHMLSLVWRGFIFWYVFFSYKVSAGIVR